MNDYTLDELVADFCHDVGASEVEPPTWVIDQTLPVGLTFLVGPPKTMKSTIIMMWGATVTGLQHEGLPTELQACEETGRVFGMSGEASAGELRYMAENGFSCPIPDNRSFLVADDPWRWRLDDDKNQRKMLSILDALQPKLFFIDPLRNFHDQDERDSGTMIRLLLPLRLWAKKNNAAVIVAHHTRKQSNDPKARNLNTSSDDIRGSSAMFGLADGLIMLTRKGEGAMRMEAIYKRGQAWERTVQLRVWDPKTPQQTAAPTQQMTEAAGMLASGKSWADVQQHYSVGAGTLARWLKRVAAAATSSVTKADQTSDMSSKDSEADPA